LTALASAWALGPGLGVASAQRRASCKGLQATIVADKNDRTLVGTAGPDVIVGNALANLIRGGGGDDVICGGGGDDQILGEAGFDRIYGGNGDDALDGGADEDELSGEIGKDSLDGGEGDDALDGGSGDDVFACSVGGGSDVVEGEGGDDLLRFTGSSLPESFDLAANGARFRLSRNVTNATIDAGGVERLVVAPLGAADAVVVGDLSGTDLELLSVDLGAVVGGGADVQVDRVTVSATNAADGVLVEGIRGFVTVRGLGVEVDVRAAESTDELTLNGLGGEDVIDATGLEVGAFRTIFNGGLGDDVFLGSDGDDVVNGGDGDDVALLGPGDDEFLWVPGDDNDVIEGQDGFDALEFNGANAAENVDLAANGGRVIFFRNVASVTMDLNDVEGVRFAALGGADTVVVNDLSGTDVVEVNVDLASTLGGTAGDAQPDTVVAVGTNGDDVAVLAGEGREAAVFGLAAQIGITGVDVLNDRVTVNLLDGDDVCEGSGLAANAIDLAANGGDDDDVLIGGDGNDVLSGGAGDDVLLGGPGLDVLDGGTGDNIEIQG
jgi:Ca2+-binding RTX toxin-like protein